MPQLIKVLAADGREHVIDFQDIESINMGPDSSSNLNAPILVKVRGRDGVIVLHGEHADGFHQAHLKILESGNWR